MQRTLPLLIILLAGALLLAMVLPAAADGDDDDGGVRDGSRSGDDDDHGDDGDDKDDRERDEDEDRDDDKGKDDKQRRDDKDADEKDGGHHGDDDRGDGKDKDGKKDHHDDGDPAPAGPSGGGSPGFPVHPTSDRADVRVSQDYDIAPGVLTYTFRIANNGGEIARDVQLDGQLPDVGSWVLTDPLHCDLATDGDVDCDLGDLAGGEAIEVVARSVLVGEVPAFTNVVQVYTPAGNGASRPSSP